MVAAYGILAYAHGLQPSHFIAYGWPAVFLILLALWLVEDSKSFPAIYRPFEFGFLVYLLFPLYLSYYLWRTRRFVGLLLLAGLLALFLLGSLAQILGETVS